MKSTFVLIFLAAGILLTACDSRVQDPWVQYENYQKEERTRSPQLDEQLDLRLQYQADR